MMFSKFYKKSSIKNILVITLSNIGDAVMTAPVMDILLRDFPSAELSVVAGPKSVSLFEGNPRISRIHVFNKRKHFLQHAQWNLGLRKHHYDLVIDLRNSMIGYFLTPRWITRPSLKVDKNLHLKDRYLQRLRQVYDFGLTTAPALAIAPSLKDEDLVDGLLKPFIGQGEPSFLVIAPQAADSAKTWHPQGFIDVANELIKQFGSKIIMVGSSADSDLINYMSRSIQGPVLNLAGRINLIQLAVVFTRSQIALVHDSGPMHLASYLNTPVVALFGPTDAKVSAPWSSINQIVCRNQQCERCLNPRSQLRHNCMSAITTQDVMGALRQVYEKIR